MKIVCQNCDAKYSIADEKVQGKVFKVRCRKCGESIVVRGGIAADPLAAALPSMPEMPGFGGKEEEGDVETRVYDYSGHNEESSTVDATEWHIVVDGEQQGPYTTEQIKEYITTGSLALETLVWRDGFDDWIPAREVRDFADAVGTAAGHGHSAVGQYEDDPAYAHDPLAGAHSHGNTYGNDSLFDAQPQGGSFNDSAGLFSSNIPEVAGSDLFSVAPEAPPATGGLFSDDSGLFGPHQGPGADEFAGVSDIFGGTDTQSPDGLFDSVDQAGTGIGPRLSAEQIMMTGQRNESSVLFSLSNLQSLVSAQEAQRQQQQQKQQPIVTNTGGSEGSGLIDIRALAGSLQKDDFEPAAASPRDDDFLSMNYGGLLAAPVLAPAPQGTSTLSKVIIIVGAVSLLAAIGIMTVALRTPRETSPEVKVLLAQIAELEKKGGGGSSEMAELQTELAKAQAEAPKSKQPTAQESEGDEDAPAAEDQEPKRGRASKERAAPKVARGASAGESPPSAPSPVASEARAPSPSQPKKGAGASELDDLLGESKTPPAQKSPAPDAPQASKDDALKETLDRSDVLAGMNSVAAIVKQCAQGQEGTVTVEVVIGPAGRVVSANPKGTFAGTPVGACAARAVRAARFPTSKKSITVTYPFKL